MLGLYYKIWVDCIKRAREQPDNKNWQTYTMIYMTMAMAFNFLFIMAILQKFLFRNYFYKMDLSFLPLRLNNILAYLVLFILPCVIINYLLIFRNKRYENLLKNYPYYNGKIFGIYFIISLMFPIVLLLGAMAFSKL